MYVRGEAACRGCGECRVQSASILQTWADGGVLARTPRLSAVNTRCAATEPNMPWYHVHEDTGAQDAVLWLDVSLNAGAVAGTQQAAALVSAGADTEAYPYSSWR